MTHTEKLMKEFEEIHERIFELSCRKSKYASKMSDTLNAAIEKALEEEYTAYYSIYKAKLAAAVETELYALDAIHGITVPRTYRKWWCFWKLQRTDAAKAVDEKIGSEIELYTEELMERIETIRKSFTDKTTPEPEEHAEEFEEESDPNEIPAETVSENDSEKIEPASAEWEEEDEDPIAHQGSAGTSQR